LNGFGLNGNYYGRASWCYIAFPFVGAIIAALMFRFEVYLDNK